MQVIVPTGRVLLASLFIVSAIKSIFWGFGDFSNAVASKNIPFPVFVAVLVLAVKIVGGISVATDYKSMYGAFSLLVFTILATIMFHNPFADPGQLTNMLKNIAIIGGIVLLIGYKLIYDDKQKENSEEDDEEEAEVQLDLEKFEGCNTCRGF